MSSLDSATTLSVTVACTVGLEPLMFPTGPTEVMVTPLEPPRLAPRLAPPLAPDLVLGLALCEVFRLLDLPIGVPPYRSRRMLAWLTRRRVYPKPSSSRKTTGPLLHLLLKVLAPW